MTELEFTNDSIQIKAPKIIIREETYTERLMNLKNTPDKAKSLLMDTLARFQSESFSQYEVDKYLHLLNQAIKDSNGFNVFQSYLLNET